MNKINVFWWKKSNEQKIERLKLNNVKRNAIFTSAHPWKAILIMTLPTVIAQLILASYQIIDKMIATNFGGNVLLNQYHTLVEHNIDPKTLINVATGYAGTVFSITFAFSLLISIGTAIKVSNALGEKNEAKVKTNIFTGQVLSLFLSLITAIAMWFLAEPIINFQAGSNNDTWKAFPEAKSIIILEATKYSRILTSGAIILFLANIWIMLLRSEGRLLIIILLNLMGFIMNIGLDFALVFSLGMLGTAIATVITWIPFLVITVLFIYYSKDTKLKINWHDFHFDRHVAISIIALGLATLFENVAQGLISMFMSRVLSSLANPKDFIDVSTPVYAQINGGIVPWLVLINAPIIGIGYGARALVGYVYGAKDYQRIWNILFRLAIFFFIILLLLVFLIVGLGQYMLQVFGVPSDIANRFKIYFIIDFMFYPLATITYVSLILFQSIGYSKTSMFVSIQRTIIVPIACIGVGAIVANNYHNGFWFFLIVGLVDVFANLIVLPILIYSYRKWHHLINQKINNTAAIMKCYDSDKNINNKK